MIERHHLRNTASATRLLTLTLTLTIAIAPLLPAEAIAAPADQDHNSHGSAVPAKLVQLVRDGTKQFADVNAATAAGYQPFLGCVSGPDHGAMGYHYVNGALVGAGELDASRPQALIYGEHSIPGRQAAFLTGCSWVCGRKPGYQRRNVSSHSSLSTRVRICKSRWAPRCVHCIC